MSNQAYETKMLFVTVKTYPNPSRKHIEILGFRDYILGLLGMRLYPVHSVYLRNTNSSVTVGYECV